MSDASNQRIGTKVIHAGQTTEPVTGAVMPPIFLSSTYAQVSPGEHSGYEYTRSHNPTRYALERMVARLEGSTIDERTDVSFGGFACSSGLAAMSLVLELVPAGGRVIAMDDLYGGSGRLLRHRATSQGLQVDFVDMTNLDLLSKALDKPAHLIWIETPTNPMLKLVDLRAVSELARQKSPNSVLACDNTFATPILQRPIEHGIDVVVHSTTKYINGHSDCVGGVIVTSRPDLAERFRFMQNAVGPVMSPFDAYMTLRGIKTLALRMNAHVAGATKIATYLESHQGVQRVIYPGLASHPHHQLASRQMDGAGGIISFDIDGDLDTAKRFLESIEIFALAESLGGVESLIEHPAIMTHASVPADMRATLGISDTLIRLSIGIEDPDDLIEAIETAMHHALPTTAG